MTSTEKIEKSEKADRRYDLIVWDWDGTIMDSTPTIVHCIQQACRDLGFKEPDDTLASHWLYRMVLIIQLMQHINYLLLLMAVNRLCHLFLQTPDLSKSSQVFPEYVYLFGCLNRL